MTKILEQYYARWTGGLINIFSPFIHRKFSILYRNFGIITSNFYYYLFCKLYAKTKGYSKRIQIINVSLSKKHIAVLVLLSLSIFNDVEDDTYFFFLEFLC